MQKFTVFSILLSLTIVLIVSDLVLHDYLGTKPEGFEAANVETSVLDLPVQAEEVVVESTAPVEEVVETAVIEQPVVEESYDILEMIEPSLSAKLFAAAGFSSPTLKETTYYGLIFQMISFSDQSEAFVHQWNLFDGQQFIGSVYEINYPSTTGGLQGYLTLRERASSLPSEGEVNEVNMYGDASFYFNHKVKTKTVHTVIRRNGTVYVFEYAYIYHEQMKKLLESL